MNHTVRLLSRVFIVRGRTERAKNATSVGHRGWAIGWSWTGAWLNIASLQIAKFWGISGSASMMWGLLLFSWEFAVPDMWLVKFCNKGIYSYKSATHHTRLHAT